MARHVAHVLAMSNGAENLWPANSREICRAVLLTAVIVAVASSPRFARRGRQGQWSWVLDALGGIAVGAVFAVLLLDQLSIYALTHIIIVCMQMSWPLQCSADVLATASPARAARFFNVTTAGIVSVLASCVLLRLLAFRWRAAGRLRVCLGALLAASLTVTVLLAGRVALVEVPGFSPIMAANIPMPTHRLVAGVMLALLLVTAVARRLSEPPLVGSAAAAEPWRHDEERYHHERRLLIFLLGGVALAVCIVTGIQLFN